MSSTLAKIKSKIIEVNLKQNENKNCFMNEN